MRTTYNRDSKLTQTSLTAVTLTDQGVEESEIARINYTADPKRLLIDDGNTAQLKALLIQELHKKIANELMP